MSLGVALFASNPRDVYHFRSNLATVHAVGVIYEPCRSGTSYPRRTRRGKLVGLTVRMLRLGLFGYSRLSFPHVLTLRNWWGHFCALV
jgi:hypothetical protein